MVARRAQRPDCESGGQAEGVGREIYLDNFDRQDYYNDPDDFDDGQDYCNDLDGFDDGQDYCDDPDDQHNFDQEYMWVGRTAKYTWSS